MLRTHRDKMSILIEQQPEAPRGARSGTVIEGAGQLKRAQPSHDI